MTGVYNFEKFPWEGGGYQRMSFFWLKNVKEETFQEERGKIKET